MQKPEARSRNSEVGNAEINAGPSVRHPALRREVCLDDFQGKSNVERRTQNVERRTQNPEPLNPGT
jgi:hypothetical protein